MAATKAPTVEQLEKRAEALAERRRRAQDRSQEAQEALVKITAEWAVATHELEQARKAAHSNGTR